VDDVLPHVLPAPGAGHDVVDVLGGGPAVLALVGVPDEHRTPGQRGARPVGDLDEVGEPDDRWNRHAELLGVVGLAVGLDDLSLGLEHQHDRAAGGHDAQRLVGDV